MYPHVKIVLFFPVVLPQYTMSIVFYTESLRQNWQYQLLLEANTQEDSWAHTHQGSPTTGGKYHLSFEELPHRKVIFK